MAVGCRADTLSFPSLSLDSISSFRLYLGGGAAMAGKDMEARRENLMEKGEEGDRRRGRAGCAGFVDGGDLQAKAAAEEEEGGRERLKRHRAAMSGRVWVPDTWGQEKLLKDWIDCAAIDRSLVPTGLMSAREALVEECRRSNAGGFPIESRCLSA